MIYSQKKEKRRSASPSRLKPLKIIMRNQKKERERSPRQKKDSPEEVTPDGGVWQAATMADGRGTARDREERLQKERPRGCGAGGRSTGERSPTAGPLVSLKVGHSLCIPDS